MITRLCKGRQKREVITSKDVNPYGGNMKIIYWLGSDRKGIMDTQWHDRRMEKSWKAAKERHCELVKRFMEDGWEEESGRTLNEVLEDIKKPDNYDAPSFHRSEKAVNELRAKGGRTAQARARARKAAE